MSVSRPPLPDIFRMVVETVEDYAIFALDAQGRITTWNRGAERIKGWSEQEILGRHFSIFYRDEDVRAGLPEQLMATARAEGRAVAEGVRVRRDGSRFWASVVLTALRDDDGAVIGFAKVTRDLTERRRAEEALAARNELLAEAERIARLGSWEWDIAADRVTWSDELFRIYGLAPAEFDGSLGGFLQRLHPDDLAATRAHIERALATGEPFDFEERIIRADGGVRILRSRGRAVRATGGDVVRLVGTCMDVTDERAREEAERQRLREQAVLEQTAAAAERFRFLARAGDVLSASLDPHVTLQNLAELAVPHIADWCAVDVVRPDGSLDRLTLVHGDPERVRLAQLISERYPRRDDAGADIPGRVLRTLETVTVPVVGDDLLQAAAVDAEHLRLLRDLGLRSIIVCPLVSQGRALGVVTFATAESGRHYADVDAALAEELAVVAASALERARLVESLARANAQLTEQAAELEIQTEELQQAMEELEVSNEELVSTNEALALQSAEAESARTMAEQANRAKSDFLASMSHELRTPLNAIAGHTQLIELGVHGPLTDKQLDALHRIQRSQRHLLALINDLLNFVKLEAGRVRVEVTDVPVAEVLADLEDMIAPQVAARGLMYAVEPPESDLLVRADRDKLDQVLLNLLSNAVKFTPAGGHVTIRCNADERHVSIHVADTGVGIPEDKLEQIFEPFVQVPPSSRSLSTEGVGLGLAISRDLMRSMGGELLVRSEPGVGSTFTARLARGQPAADAGAPRTEAHVS